VSAAEVLAAHHIDAFQPMRRCSCGSAIPWSVEHQLDALKAAGYAVVELPKPPPESHRWVDADGNPDWDAHADAALQCILDRLEDQYWITIKDGLIHLPYDGTGDTPMQARELAAALLAAADVAECVS
jgi:hypothetical protein